MPHIIPGGNLPLGNLQRTDPLLGRSFNLRNNRGRSPTWNPPDFYRTLKYFYPIFKVYLQIDLVEMLVHEGDQGLLHNLRINKCQNKRQKKSKMTIINLNAVKINLCDYKKKL